MMDVMSSQDILPATENVGDYLVVKLLHFLSNGGIDILEDHKGIMLQNENITTHKREGNCGTKGDNLHKSSFIILEAGQKKTIDILHIAAAYVNKRNASGKTPLHLSAEIGDKELVDIFLNVGSNVSAMGKSKKTALHLSASKGHKEIVKILLEAGAVVNAVDDFLQTPLHYSADKGYKGVVEILLNAGARVDVENNYKYTPLHLSLDNNHLDVSETLVRAGACVRQRQTCSLPQLAFLLLIVSIVIYTIVVAARFFINQICSSASEFTQP